MSWTDWREAFAKACDGTHWTIEAIEQALSGGLWQQLEANGCCFLVEVIDYPQERACQVMWAAGDLKSILAAADDLEAWARRQGCTEMLIEGHQGWQRALRELGYRPWSVTLRKGLHGRLH
jgi:hypothetical protein